MSGCSNSIRSRSPRHPSCSVVRSQVVVEPRTTQARACTKRKYATPVDAMLALQRIQRQRNLEGVDKHERCWYSCTHTHCNGAYHLTSLTEWDGNEKRI